MNSVSTLNIWPAQVSYVFVWAFWKKKNFFKEVPLFSVCVVILSKKTLEKPYGHMAHESIKYTIDTDEWIAI